MPTMNSTDLVYNACRAGICNAVLLNISQGLANDKSKMPRM